MTKRIRIVPGGTSASKSVSILLYLIHLAQSDKTPTLTSCVSESFPHLKRGIIRDFLLIMQSHGYFRDARWNKTDCTYTFETGSKIEFFSVDQPSKVRGPRRDRLFMNEANNIKFEAFEQLEVRTKELVYIDFNPVNEFWVHTEIIGVRDDCEVITLTYLDNEALSPEIVRSIEQRKNNTRWWRVYGLGLMGEFEGKIYNDWKIIDKIPPEARLERYGLDFGFTNDPTVIEGIYRWNGAIIIDEVCYQKGLSNRTIADILNNIEKALVIADSSEPKSIDEIKNYGINIIGAIKGPGSVLKGIQYVQDQVIFITKRSVKTLTAYRNFKWVIDKDGKTINVPDDSIHEWSNPMDAIRYGLNSFNVREEEITYDDPEPDILYSAIGI